MPTLDEIKEGAALSKKLRNDIKKRVPEKVFKDIYSPVISLMSMQYSSGKYYLPLEKRRILADFIDRASRNEQVAVIKGIEDFVDKEAEKFSKDKKKKDPKVKNNSEELESSCYGCNYSTTISYNLVPEKGVAEETCDADDKKVITEASLAVYDDGNPFIVVICSKGICGDDEQAEHLCKDYLSMLDRSMSNEYNASLFKKVRGRKGSDAGAFYAASTGMQGIGEMFSKIEKFYLEGKKNKEERKKISENVRKVRDRIKSDLNGEINLYKKSLKRK